jgi:hypothetical protein
MKFKLFIASIAIAFLTVTLSSSCEKKTDCKLTIKTIDEKGFVYPNAKVKLFANVKNSTGATVEADIKAEGSSDASGVSTYTFKLPAILDIKCELDTMGGIGIIKLEEGKSVEKVITMKKI